MFFTQKSFLTLLKLIFISSFCYCQKNEIKITFLGNSSLHLSDSNNNIYIDFPYKSGAYGYMEYDDSKIKEIENESFFLFTHKHADHYSKPLVKKLNKNHVLKNRKKINKLNTYLKDFNIEIFKTKHKFTFKHFSYLITWHGKRIFISGDTENSETIASIKDIDWAFIPYWIISDSNKKGLKIDASNIRIYHLYPNQKLNFDTSQYKLLNKPGINISIPY